MLDKGKAFGRVFKNEAYGDHYGRPDVPLHQGVFKNISRLAMMKKMKGK